MASGLDWTIVRPPAIYGPRDREMFELFRAAQWGVVPMPRGGRASLIHVDDLARLLLALVPGGEGVTHRAVRARRRQARRLEPPRAGARRSAGRSAGGVGACSCRAGRWHCGGRARDRLLRGRAPS